MDKRYDFLIVGSGLYGAVFANRAKAAGYSCMILEKRPHIGGNVYVETVEGIQVHRYGAHIFHTSNQQVWDYVNRFASFNHYINSPLANYKGELYNLPFNMNTFNRLWGVITPAEAKAKIEAQRQQGYIGTPSNLEEKALGMVGPEIYEKLVRHYTEKQWGRPCTELPAFIIARLPLRFTYDNNYFSDPYQGIPINGYTALIERLIEGVETRSETDYLDNCQYWNSIARHIVFTGPIDAFFNYQLGELEYRSLRFETEILETDNYQGNAVVNYTDAETPYTRIIEHKHFLFDKQPRTVISKEFSTAWKRGIEPYYPINDDKNNNLYAQYRKMAEQNARVTFGGRLGEYKYLNMDQVVERALLQTTPERLKELLLSH